MPSPVRRFVRRAAEFAGAAALAAAPGLSPALTATAAAQDRGAGAPSYNGFQGGSRNYGGLSQTLRDGGAGLRGRVATPGVTIRNPFGLGGFGVNGFGPGGFGFGGTGLYGPGIYGPGYYNGFYGLQPNGAGFVPTYTGVGFNGPYTVPVPFGPTVAVAPGAVGYGLGFSGLNGYGTGFGTGLGGYGAGLNGFQRPVQVGVGSGAVGGLNPTGAVVGGNLGPNPAIAQGLREDAQRWRGAVDLGDAGPLPAADRSPTERELAESLKLQRQGDEAFAALDYHKAARRYRDAAESAPTRGEPLYRLAFARVATGDYREAEEQLRRALALDPSLAVNGPSLNDLFGGKAGLGNDLARTSAVSGVAEYARQDVRDPDRLFLLAAVMHAGGDTRAREIFEAAWRLTGGRPHLRAYLDPVAVRRLEEAPAGPADDDPAALPIPDEA